MKNLKDLLPIAARLVRADCIRELEGICENQVAVRTQRLESLLLGVTSALREEAVLIHEIYNDLK